MEVDSTLASVLGGFSGLSRLFTTPGSDVQALVQLALAPGEPSVPQGESQPYPSNGSAQEGGLVKKRSRGRPKGSTSNGKKGNNSLAEAEEELASKLRALELLQREHDLLEGRVQILEMVVELRSEHIKRLEELKAMKGDVRLGPMGLTTEELIKRPWKDMAVHFRDLMAQVGSVLMQSTATGDPGPVIALISSAREMYKFSMLCREDAMIASGRNINELCVSAEDATLAPQSHWESVVAQLNITPEQARLTWLLYEMYNKWHACQLAERARLSGLMSQVLSVTRYGKVFTDATAGRYTDDVILNKIKQNVQSERCLMVLVSECFQCRILTHMQTAEVLLHSYPYVPDKIGLLAAVAALHAPPSPLPAQPTLQIANCSGSTAAAIAAGAPTKPLSLLCTAPSTPTGTRSQLPGNSISMPGGPVQARQFSDQPQYQGGLSQAFSSTQDLLQQSNKVAVKREGSDPHPINHLPTCLSAPALPSMASAVSAPIPGAPGVGPMDVGSYQSTSFLQPQGTGRAQQGLPGGTAPQAMQPTAAQPEAGGVQHLTPQAGYLYGAGPDATFSLREAGMAWPMQAQARSGSTDLTSGSEGMQRQSPASVPNFPWSHGALPGTQPAGAGAAQALAQGISAPGRSGSDRLSPQPSSSSGGDGGASSHSVRGSAPPPPQWGSSGALLHASSGEHTVVNGMQGPGGPRGSLSSCQSWGGGVGLAAAPGSDLLVHVSTAPVEVQGAAKLAASSDLLGAAAATYSSSTASSLSALQRFVSQASAEQALPATAYGPGAEASAQPPSFSSMLPPAPMADTPLLQKAMANQAAAAAAAAGGVGDVGSVFGATVMDLGAERQPSGEDLWSLFHSLARDDEPMAGPVV